MAGSNGNGTQEIDLEALYSRVAARVRIAGESRTVLQLDAAGWKIYDRIRDVVINARNGIAPPEGISTEEFYSLVAKCLPDTPRDVVWGSDTVQGIPAEMGGHILGLASKTLQAVEESIPKAEAPTAGEVLTPSSA